MLGSRQHKACLSTITADSTYHPQELCSFIQNNRIKQFNGVLEILDPGSNLLIETESLSFIKSLKVHFVI